MRTGTTFNKKHKHTVLKLCIAGAEKGKPLVEYDNALKILLVYTKRLENEYRVELVENSPTFLTTPRTDYEKEVENIIDYHLHSALSLACDWSK